MKLKLYNKTYDVTPFKSTYLNNKTLAVLLEDSDGYPFATLTVNIEASNTMANHEYAFVDTNNCPWAEEFIKESNLGTPVGFTGFSGFCEYPLYKFNTELMKDVERY